MESLSSTIILVHASTSLWAVQCRRFHSVIIRNIFCISVSHIPCTSLPVAISASCWDPCLTWSRMSSMRLKPLPPFLYSDLEWTSRISAHMKRVIWIIKMESWDGYWGVNYWSHKLFAVVDNLIISDEDFYRDFPCSLWHLIFSLKLSSFGFISSVLEPNLYLKVNEDHIIRSFSQLNCKKKLISYWWH